MKNKLTILLLSLCFTGFADAQQAERHEHDRERRRIVRHRDGKYGQQQCERRDHQTDQYRFAPADTVHQQARRHGKDQKPQEYHQREQSGHGVRQPEVFFDEVRSGSHQIDEAHREEREHDRDQFQVEVA